MDAIEMLLTRRSTRYYTDQPVPKDFVEKIVDAGRMAATARNVQPWNFVVVTDKIMREKIAALADHGRFIQSAPSCIALFCEDTKYYLEDGSAATQNILLAAHALGVHSCWVAGDKKDYAAEVRSLLKVPETKRLVSIITLGYEGKPVARPPKKSVGDVIHWDTFKS